MRIRVDELDDPRAVMIELMRRDFGCFLERAFAWVNGGKAMVWNWHFDAIAYRLEQVAAGLNQHLLVTLPSRSGKSITNSIAWVAWMLRRDPTRSFVCVSYSNELSAKLARDCLAIMQSDWYRELFPGTVISSRRSAAYDFETTAGGGAAGDLGWRNPDRAWRRHHHPRRRHQARGSQLGDHPHVHQRVVPINSGLPTQ